MANENEKLPEKIVVVFNKGVSPFQPGEMAGYEPGEYVDGLLEKKIVRLANQADKDAYNKQRAIERAHRG